MDKEKEIKSIWIKYRTNRTPSIIPCMDQQFLNENGNIQHAFECFSLRPSCFAGVLRWRVSGEFATVLLHADNICVEPSKYPCIGQHPTSVWPTSDSCWCMSTSSHQAELWECGVLIKAQVTFSLGTIQQCNLSLPHRDSTAGSPSSCWIHGICAAVN